MNKKAKKSTNHLKYVKQDPIRKALLQRFLNELSEAVNQVDPDSVLDAGSGEGFVLSYLNDHCSIDTMAGVDISQQAVDIATKQLPKASFTKGSVYELPYDDESFDLVLCNEVIEHLEDHEKALKELKRVSKRHIIVSVPNEPWFMLGSLAGGKYVTRLGNHPEHINHWTYNGFIDYLKKNGLNVYPVAWHKTFPWTLIVCEK